MSKSRSTTKRRTKSKPDREALLVARAGHWVGDRTAVDDELRALLDRQGSGSGTRLRGFLHALGAQRARGLARLLEAHEQVLERLLDPRRLAAVKDPEMLLKLARVTSELIDSRVAYLERRASENADELFNRLARQAQSEERNDEEAFLMQLTPQQRHAARTFLLRLWEHEASRSTNGNGAQ